MFDAIMGKVLPALAGGAIKRLFRGRSSTTKTKADLVGLRKEADAAGVNFLTALRTVGGAFTETQQPQLGGLDFLGDALGAGIRTAFNGDKIAQDKERDRLELAIMREELKHRQTENKVIQGQDFGFSIPKAVTTSNEQGASSNQSIVSALAGGKSLSRSTTLGDSGKHNAPHRDVKIHEYGSFSGLSEINNAYTGGPVTIFGNDGDPIDIWEMAALAIQVAPQMAYNHWIKPYRRPDALDPATGLHYPDFAHRPKARPKSYATWDNTRAGGPLHKFK